MALKRLPPKTKIRRLPALLQPLHAACPAEISVNPGQFRTRAFGGYGFVRNEKQRRTVCFDAIQLTGTTIHITDQALNSMPFRLSAQPRCLNDWLSGSLLFWGKGQKLRDEFQSQGSDFSRDLAPSLLELFAVSAKRVAFGQKTDHPSLDVVVEHRKLFTLGVVENRCGLLGVHVR